MSDITDEELLDETARINEEFMRHFAHILPSSPRWRYFEHNGWRYGWTTERGRHNGKEGFIAMVYKPIGKGARSGNPSQWRLVKQVVFARRKVAKARAYQWYTKAAES